MSLATQIHYDHELNYVLLLNYTFSLPKCDINNTRYIGLDVCAIRK